MILKDIFENLKQTMPHRFEDDIIVEFINNALKEVYRFVSPMDSFIFSASGAETYPLVPGIKPEQIHSVTVGEVHYYPRRLQELSRENIWFIAPDGFINFFPLPKFGSEIVITFDNAEFDLGKKDDFEYDGGEGELDTFYNQPIIIYDEYTDMIVCYVKFQIARAREDISSANNYRDSFEIMRRNAMQRIYDKRGKYPETEDVNGRWRRGAWNRWVIRHR